MKLFRKADILGTKYSVYRVSSGENEYMENAQLDAFEIVLPLLDAMNNVDSNRLDGVEQFIPALIQSPVDNSIHRIPAVHPW